MNRALLLGGAGGLTVTAALVLTFFVEKAPQPELAAMVESPSPVAAGTAADQPRILPPDTASSQAAQPEAPVAPRFDVVRVNPRGDAVIAGRAAPNADVTIRDGEKEVGRARADARGEWVVVPREPLPSGSRELSLTAKAPEENPVQSQQNVVVVVPDRMEKADEAMPGPLAVLVPRDGAGESIVVQKPGDATRSSPETAPARPVAPVAQAAQRAEPSGDAAGPAPEPVVASASPAADSAEPQPLSIEAVDYDEGGHVIISGTAEPHARLHVYVENHFAGAGVADGSGRWRLVPGSALTPGLHTLRVDQVDRDGKVRGRVETRFARLRPAEAVPPGNSVVFVKPGNSLWRIARRVYGHGIRYTVIYNANREQIRDPDLIYPGQVFFVPHVN